MNMRKRCVALSSLALLLLTGCAGFNSSKDDQNAAFASEDLGELLRFGSDLANMAESSRAEVCQALLNRQQEAPSAGIQLHLMTGRLLSDACGDINTILAGADSTLMNNLSDERVRWLAAAQTEALKRMGDQSRKLAVLERRPKTAPSLAYPKKRKPESNKPAVPKPRKGIPPQTYRAERQKPVPEQNEGAEPQTGLPEPQPAMPQQPAAPQPEPPKGNPGLLQNKLDAIRSLENKLDRPGDGN